MRTSTIGATLLGIVALGSAALGDSPRDAKASEKDKASGKAGDKDADKAVVFSMPSREYAKLDDASKKVLAKHKVDSECATYMQALDNCQQLLKKCEDKPTTGDIKKAKPPPK